MMSRLKKLLCLMLCGALVFSNVVIANAAETQAEKTYDIYPVVREIAYDGTEFVLDDQVNVVYETGIDEATKNYLSEVLEENGISAAVVTAPVDGECNILLGVNGSGECVDAYEDTLTLKTENLYANYDSYVLEAKEDQITIVGRDTDAVFYGVATLKMMLSSFEDDVLLGARIEDYAGIEYRGFVEGFYGGWDYETRAELMKFARDVKMNIYVYASKTDAYHTSKWAELYPDSDLQQIKELVRIGQETKCRYVWSVHLGSFFSGLDISANAALYEERYSKLEAKLTQLYEAGVRKFDILNDDFGGGSHGDVVTVLNRLNEEFIIPRGCEPITYCPQGYNRSWSGTGAELDALANLDDSIILYWTGDDVNSPITQSTVDYVAGRTGQPVCFWLNYPVNEHAKSGIFLGNIDHYARDGVTGLKAAVSNPSRFGQSNKVALFQLACLFWNNANYSAHAEEIWHDSFNYLEAGVEDAYRTIARNVANCPGSSRVSAGFPESEYIRENLEAVSAAISNGEPIEDLEDTRILLNEFAAILNAASVFRENCANTDLVAELEPWLKSLEGVTAAGQAALHSIIALENGNDAEAWTYFAAAGKALQTWDAYLTCDDPSVTNKALAGSKRLQPFAADMVAYAERTLTPLFDPNYSAQTLYAVLGGQKQRMDDNAGKMLDGDLTTYAQWNVVQQQNDYFGVDLGVVKTVTDISIVQANSDTHHDYFHKAVLEYSEDGKTFTQLGDRYNDTYRIELDGLDIRARYVRLRLAETGTANKPDYWTHVREFTVNREKPEGDRVYTNVEAYARQPLTIEGKEYSLSGLTDVTLAAGEYIGIRFTDLSMVSSIVKEGTGLEDLRFEYSANAAQWTGADALDGPAAVKYVRLYNGTDAAVTFTLNKLGATVERTKADPKFLETNLTGGLKEGSWTNVFDGQEGTYAWTNEGQAAGDYITFDLGANIALYDVTVVTADGNPRLYNAEIQISANNTDWETIAAVVNDNSVFEVPYRYVRANANGANAKYLRIYFTGSTGYYFRLHEIFLNTTVEASDETEEITATFGTDIRNAIDGNLSSLFSGRAAAEDSIVYRFTEATSFRAISILQDPGSISNAAVSLLRNEGYVPIGRLDESAKKFVLDSNEDVFGLKITFEEETDIALYEIYLDADKNASDDIGEYTDPIIKEALAQPGNLAAGKEVTVSGTSDGNKDNVNDGDTSTKWDSDFIKGSSARDHSWIYIDLGADKTSIFDEMTMHYFNKIYPTLMYIQISNDAAVWQNISELTRDHNGQTHPVVTESYETPYAARYVRLFFEELNSAAAGNGVGLTEWSITGIALPDVSLKTVSRVDAVTKEVNAELTEADLPRFVQATLTQAIAGDIEVMVPVSWDLSSYDAGQPGVYEIEGSLSLPASVDAADNTVTVNVTVQRSSTVIASGWSGATQWTLTDDGVLTVYGSGNMKNYGYGGGQPWLDKGVDITSVVIEEGVTSVGSGAFRNLTTLETVSLPGTMTQMGEAAFYGCTSLTSVEIPASLWTIQPYTFKNCTALAEVKFNEGNLMKISDGAFYGTGLRSLVLPDCLDILDVYAFKGCAALESITLGSGLTELREAIFYGTAIPTITVPEGITKIGPYAFKNCVALETIDLPTTLKSVGEASFYACTGLKTVELPDAVISIGNYAFRKCAAIEELTFGAELVTIGECSFYGCTGLTEIVIPDKVTAIKPYAFKTCTGLTSVILGSSVKTIGEGAFNTCTGLKTIIFPASLTAIGDYCFSGSWNLWKLTFLGDAPAIGTGAFKGMAATAYYPGDNATWTADTMQNYGGKITWKAQ